MLTGAARAVPADIGGKEARRPCLTIGAHEMAQGRSGTGDFSKGQFRDF
jgi:hypothetical protein